MKSSGEGASFGKGNSSLGSRIPMFYASTNNTNLREISFKDLIRPKEDPSQNYPFNPKPTTNNYSRTPLTNRVSYDLDKNKISYSDWDYNKDKRKELEYASPKPFSGSYGGDGGSSYASSSPKCGSGSYKMAA
ncbi:MAG: hypothetical protein PHH54_01870 [Candidatus Nanoarchaeia archaeon]|nr:hypothetical protein [Candidatus Nanoarchaeia archaeon]MDD5740710.1 hypothetical protein [Candidatus Nanoarchaeia archaeon]